MIVWQLSSELSRDNVSTVSLEFSVLHGDLELQNFRNAAIFQSYTVILGKMFKNSKLLVYTWNLTEKKEI